MRIFLKSWNNLSIAKKLYTVVGIMAILIGAELATLRFAMRKLSAVRAFVGGEGLWSKAQKNAVFSLQLYGLTRDERNYQAYIDHLKITDGDHQARVELAKPHPNLEVVRQGFLAGHIHPDDITPMIELLRGYSWISYLQKAIQSWTQEDHLLIQLKAQSILYRRLLASPAANSLKLHYVLQQINALNEQLTLIEEDFSRALGEGSRWLERLVISLLFLAVLMVEGIGLTLTFFTSRAISRGLGQLRDAAQRIGEGDFRQTLTVNSEDEFGQLTASINQMGQVLQKSYQELETRVQERTAKLGALAEENERLYQEAKAAVQARDEFLSVASHELNTPLTSLQLRLQMTPNILKKIPDDPLLEKLKDNIRICERQTKRLTSLVQELMDITRIRLGRLELKRENTDLRSVVSDVILQLKADAKKAGSVISLEPGSETSADLDPNRIHQVVMNVLSNAIKYGNGKPIEVRIEKTPEAIRFQIRDHGDGISPDQQTRIFERFERVANDQNISGLGLGLYITRQIVQAHGGSITVQSAMGAGALFTVQLPVALFKQPA